MQRSHSSYEHPKQARRSEFMEWFDRQDRKPSPPAETKEEKPKVKAQPIYISDDSDEEVAPVPKQSPIFIDDSDSDDVPTEPPMIIDSEAEEEADDWEARKEAFIAEYKEEVQDIMGRFFKIGGKLSADFFGTEQHYTIEFFRFAVRIKPMWEAELKKDEERAKDRAKYRAIREEMIYSKRLRVNYGTALWNWYCGNKSRFRDHQRRFFKDIRKFIEDEKTFLGE